jgi:hypothetical protein
MKHRPLALLAAMALAAPAAAQPTAGLSLAVPAGPGQQALALRAEGGAIRARVCAAAPCTPDGGALLPLPEDVRPLLPSARAKTIALAGGRSVARVDVPGAAAGSAWVLLMAAPPAGKGSEPLLLWSGWTGAPTGQPGEEVRASVVEEPAQGGARVLVGEIRDDVTLCGRPALVGARAIDPATLELARGASVQNLSSEERGKAVKIAAERAPAGGPAPVRVLRAASASSAFQKRLGAATDGDLATAWSENKTGDGQGEFVALSAPDEVGITAIDLVVRPTADVPDGAAPRSLFLATPDRVFAVSMPEDAWKQPPGTRYAVKLPAEIHTTCLAVVLDEAYAPRGKAEVKVTIAEIEAHTAFDGATPESLAGALAGGGERARGAAALLSRAGKAGTAAAMAAYDKLDDQGRQLAASVIDAAPCSEQGPFFAARFAALTGDPATQHAAPGEMDPELFHARDRLRQCGRAAAPALAKTIVEGPPRASVAAAEELAMLAPGEAVVAILDAMPKASDPVRRDLRAALARAASNPHAAPALHDEIARAKLDARPEVVAVDLLRAMGPALARVDGSAEAFGAVAARATSFRGRYLLQIPAAELAKAGDARAAGYLRDALRKDEDAHVRARAAEAAGRVPALAGELLAALDDADARVREAALDALARAQGAGAPPPDGLAAALGKRLSTDDWTFVRAGAARALGAMPADAAIDQALAAALFDVSPDVRGRALDGLGAHRAVAHADAIRERQDDDEETLDVRAHAILALASLCDARSLSAWTKLARAAKVPMDERDRRLGSAAIAALGEIHPADLAERLAPLLDKDAPAPAREMAKAAMAEKGCSAKR